MFNLIRTESILNLYVCLYSFVIATDYWQQRFPGKYVALDISMTYIIVAFTTVLLNNVFLSLATLHARVTFGYIVSFTTLIFVAICEVAYHVFEASSEYSINLIAVGFVAIGCTGKHSHKSTILNNYLIYL